MAMAAQFERDMISERVAAAAPGKAERGSYNGGPIPFGYELGDDGGLVPSEDAKWIRYMFRRYAHEGASFYAICAELEAEGVPNSRGGKWRNNAVSARIRNDIYIGRVSGGAEGKHEPLIDFRHLAAGAGAPQRHGRVRGQRARPQTSRAPARPGDVEV